ncbi:MAG: hypothetical protein ABH854_02665 [Candidatus Diapherotrites archaeon]
MEREKIMVVVAILAIAVFAALIYGGFSGKAAQGVVPAGAGNSGEIAAPEPEVSGSAEQAWEPGPGEDDLYRQPDSDWSE